jgi:hypothetical protein
MKRTLTNYAGILVFGAVALEPCLAAEKSNAGWLEVDLMLLG